MENKNYQEPTFEPQETLQEIAEGAMIIVSGEAPR